ncbi:MAG TPA: hypothetical protein VMZ53_28355 [Kofleriaceae bacterium]|nr:hypothetical protein [Kofleriaceae bacterium]
MAANRMLIVVALSSACGRFSFDERELDAKQDIDAVARCTAFGPWSKPEMPQDISSDAEEYNGTIESSGTTIIFPSGRAGGMGSADLYMATRPSTSEPFATPVNLANVNSVAADMAPTLSNDELTLYFTSNRGGGPFRLYEATRASRALPFGVPSLVPGPFTGLGEVGGPDISRDGLALYFDATAGGTGGYDLWVATRASVGDPWGTPSEVSGVNTTGSENEPTIDDDGLTIYYASDAFEPAQDLVVATRPDLASPFSTPTKVPLSLNPGVGEYGADISADGLWMELSIHLGAPMNTNVWLSSRVCL